MIKWVTEPQTLLVILITMKILKHLRILLLEDVMFISDAKVSNMQAICKLNDLSCPIKCLICTMKPVCL